MSRCLRGIPYSHTSNPLCERQIRVLKENVRIWCKTERTRDWVRLLPVISLMDELPREFSYWLLAP